MNSNETMTPQERLEAIAELLVRAIQLGIEKNDASTQTTSVTSEPNCRVTVDCEEHANRIDRESVLNKSLIIKGDSHGKSIEEKEKDQIR